AANIQVWVGDKIVWIKISGRANFHVSADFKSLVTGLWQQGQTRFVLDLTGCQLMDSTFLGVLAGLGLERSGNGTASVELLNPNPRVADMIENLGIQHLFCTVHAAPAETAEMSPLEPTPGQADKEEISRTCLEAHRLLMEINPNNVPKFKDVARFLEEDL